MDDISTIVVDTATRLFDDHVTHALLAEAEDGRWPNDLWAAVEDAGLPAAMIPEAHGGFGLDGVTAVGLVRLAGRHALPLPLAETMLAARLLAEAGIEPPTGPLAFVAATTDDLVLAPSGGGCRLDGVARRVPWGRFVGAVAIVADTAEGTKIALVDGSEATVAEGGNLAREPRDDLTFAVDLTAERVAPCRHRAADVRAMGAALRVAAMAGAIEATLARTVAHVGERVQFGKALAKFQAVQQAMAVMAGQAAAAGGAADMAAEELAGRLDPAIVAAAKIRCGEAAGIVAANAHQLHGAIGFSFEHDLHFFTKRLWSWRDEFGGEAEWSRRLGERVFAHTDGDLWSFVTAA